MQSCGTLRAGEGRAAAHAAALKRRQRSFARLISLLCCGRRLSVHPPLKHCLYVAELGTTSFGNHSVNFEMNIPRSPSPSVGRWVDRAFPCIFPGSLTAPSCRPTLPVLAIEAHGHQYLSAQAASRPNGINDSLLHPHGRNATFEKVYCPSLAGRK